MVTDNTSQADDTTAFLRAARSGNLEKVIEFLDIDLDINTANSNGLNALHLASKDGHVEIVTELLKRGAKVDAATKKGNTALHIASLAGQVEIVNILIQYGAAVNIQSQNGFTPLYMAAQENHDQVVKLLLSNGANQSLATEDGFTPLAVAMQQGHDKVVSVLLENDSKGKVRLPALHIAAKKDDCKAADLLLQNDHKPDVTSKSGFTPLHIAAHYGNEEIARLLIKRGADVNYLAKHNISPLHVAAKWGKNNMVKVLLDNSAQIDAKTRDGLTPLHCAARSGHEQVVTTLLENSAPISARTKNGLAPLHMASQGDHVDAARVLLYHRAPVDEVTIDYLTSLHVAAHCGHVRVAKLLLDRKADPNARALNGFTPLHIACKKNRIKVVELLLKHGASIESTTESGLTPLHVASFMGCMNIVIFLLQHDANPDVPTVRGETPLHLAARANQTDIIRILLRNGAKVDARAREQQTPLHIASRLGNIDIVMLLLQHGAAVDTTTKDMYTALHIAAKEGQEEVATILVENNASLKATTKNGYTPLHVAAKYGNMNVAKILLQKDSKLDAQGKNDISPLHLACHYDHPNVANLLLEKGASPHLVSQNGHTPLHIAARKNQMDIASTLLESGANANAESKAGFTPLHLSAQKGHFDMTNILIEHGADPNHKAKNGLSALHLCAQEDFIRVASILVKSGTDLESQTETGYRPIHVAAHFGNLSMIRFLLKHNADIDVRTNQNYTPLHQAAQQGHAHIVTALLEANASHKARTNDGLTPLNIAQKLGYISVMEVLKGLSYDSLTPDNKNWEEKYKVIAPESLQETSFMSDSDDEGGSDTLINEQPYRYLTADLMKSLRDDSLPIDVTRDDPIHRPVTKEEKQEFTQSNNYCLAENFDSTDGLNLGFLVSFLVDARGGAMKGCRHSGVRIIVPPRRATMPIRVTCRLVKPTKVANPPPLMEGEALATRIIEMGPVGATFLGPVLIDIPHFASIRGKEREIIILRSENGETWKEHDNSSDNDDTLLNTPYDPQMSASHSGRITRILTTDFPQYFAIVTRIKQEVHVIGAEGGILISSVANHVQAVFPPGALTKKIKVGLQAHVIPADLTAKLLGNCVAVSPVITIEPRRRKFHKPITLTIPVPQAANKGMINQYGGETPTLRLLCSIAGGTCESQWEDVTGSTPLTFMNDRVSFTTTVSARFWLMDCRNIGAVPKMATELYEESLFVPYVTNFVIYSKRMDILEATLRILCMTDGKEGLHTLERQEEFVEIVKSRDVEALDGKDLYIEFSGNLIPVTKSGVQLKFTFKAFRQNRLSFHVKVKDPLLDPVARMLFMRDPKVAKGEAPQQPLCVLNIVLPEITTKVEIQKQLKDYEDSNIINQKMDTYNSEYKMEENEKCDVSKEISSEKKFIADTLQKEQTDAVTIHESLAQKAACPLESVDASYPNKVVGQELDISLNAEKQTYSEKRKFWEDISRKRESYQRSESEISRTSQLTINESDSEYMQNVASTDDTTDIMETNIVSEIGKSETIEDLNVPDISECSVAEKAHYFEEQIQKELTKIPKQDSIKSEKEKSIKTIPIDREKIETEEKHVTESREVEKLAEMLDQQDEVVLETEEKKVDDRKLVERLASEEEKEQDESKHEITTESVVNITREMLDKEREVAEKMYTNIKESTTKVEGGAEPENLKEHSQEIELENMVEGLSDDRKMDTQMLDDIIKERKDLSGKVQKYGKEVLTRETMFLPGEVKVPTTQVDMPDKASVHMKTTEISKEMITEQKEQAEKSKKPIEEIVEDKEVIKRPAKEIQAKIFESVTKTEVETADVIAATKEETEELQKTVQQTIEKKTEMEQSVEEKHIEPNKFTGGAYIDTVTITDKPREDTEEPEKEHAQETSIEQKSETSESKTEDIIKETSSGRRIITEETTIIYKVQKDGTLLQEQVLKSVQIEGANGVPITQVPEVSIETKIFEKGLPEIMYEPQSIRDTKTATMPLANVKAEIQQFLEAGRKAQEEDSKVSTSLPEQKETKTEENTISEVKKQTLFEEICELPEKKEETITKEVEVEGEKAETEVVMSTETPIMEAEVKQMKKEFESRIPISTAKAEKEKAQKETKPKTSPEAKPEKSETSKDSSREPSDVTSPTSKKKEYESRIPKRIVDAKPTEKTAKKDTHIRKGSETYTITEKKSSEEVTSKHEEHLTTKSETQTFSKTFTDPQEAFKMFEDMDSTKKDFATVTSKVDHKTSSMLEKKEVISSEITTGTDKVITHEEKKHVEKKKTSESKLKKESPSEILEEKKSKFEEIDRTAVQKMSMNLSDGLEVIDACASESRAENKKEQLQKTLEDKEGIITHESGSTRLRETEADVAIRIKKDISGESDDHDDTKPLSDIGKRVSKAIVDADKVEMIAQGESHKEIKESFNVTEFVPCETPAEGTVEKTNENVESKRAKETIESLEEKQKQTFKEIEARTIAESLIRSIESEIEKRSTSELKSEQRGKEYLDQILTQSPDTDHDKLADDLTRKFESIMKKSMNEQAAKSKIRSSVDEDLGEKGSTRDSMSISEDITKDEESSPRDKEESFPISYSQVRPQDRDITLSPSSISEQIDFEETIDVDTNELEDISKPTLSLQSEKHQSDRSSSQIEPIQKDVYSDETFPQDKIVYEISGARVLEILEPGVDSQSRQNSMDVPSLEMDEHKVSEPTSKGIPSLQESTGGSLERMPQECDITISPSTVSEDTNIDYSLVHEQPPPISMPQEHDIGMKRADSFEIESPPMSSPRTKVPGLEIKPVNWMIGDVKIEISETLQPSQVFNQELEAYESSMRQQARIPSQDGSTDHEQESGVKSSDDASVVESVKETFTEAVQLTTPSTKSKFTVIPVSEQDLESELVENALDISCHQLVDTLKGEQHTKTTEDDVGLKEPLSVDIATMEDNETDNGMLKMVSQEIPVEDTDISNIQHIDSDTQKVSEEFSVSLSNETVTPPVTVDITEEFKGDEEKRNVVEDTLKPDVVLKLEKTTKSSMPDDRYVLKEWTDAYLAKMKPSSEEYKRHMEKSTDKHDKPGKSTAVPSDTCAFKIKKDDLSNVDLSARYAITVLDQVVNKEIAEVKESLEAAKQDLIEELSENSETVIQIKDSPSEFQFKLQPESIPNDLPFLYRPPSPEKVHQRDTEGLKPEPADMKPSQDETPKEETEYSLKNRTDVEESTSSSIEEPVKVRKEETPAIEAGKSEIETIIAVHEDTKDDDEGRPSPLPASRSGSDVDNKDESSSLAPPHPVARRRQKPTRTSKRDKRVTSESEADVGSSSGDSSNYQSCDYEIGSGPSSRPSSSDVEALQSCGAPSATVSEYETAMMSIEHSSPSRPTSQEYHTAATTLSSRESMKSLNSLSSGHLGSIDSTSEFSETLVPSEADVDKDEIEANIECALEEEPAEQSDSSGSDIPIDESMDKLDSDTPCRMKRSSEMIFPQIIDDNATAEAEPMEVTTEGSRGIDSATSAFTMTAGVVESVDIMTSRVSDDGVQSVCTQVISTQARPPMESESSIEQSETTALDSETMDKLTETGMDDQTMEPDSLEPGSSMSGVASESPEPTVRTSALSMMQQASMSTSSTSGVSIDTVIEKEKSDRHSPDSDSFELIDKPDIIDDFVVIEEVGREAEEYDSEGKSIRISTIPHVTSKNYDRDLENLITENKDDAQVSTSQASRNNELFDFESEESPPQASNDDQYSQSYSDEEQYEGGKKWIEMQFQAEARVYDIEYDRGPLEDIKEEEITDFEAGSSRFGSLGSHKESIGSVGSMRGSFGSTPDYDVLTGKKYFTKPTDHDNVSLSSLQEFEHLESTVAAENSKKVQCGSQDSINNGSFTKRYVASRSGHGDDVSLSSLKDFEGLERACREAHLIELRAREEEDLLEHESPENKYKLETLARTRTETSAAGSFNPSTSGSDDYEKRIKEIDEIIRIAQSNVEKFDRQDDTTEDISQIDITDAEKIGGQATMQTVTKQEELDDVQPQKETNIMETSTDSLELEDNADKKHPLCRSSDSLEMKTTLDFPSLSSDSLNNVRDAKEIQVEQVSNVRRISSDSLDMPLLEQQDVEAHEKDSESSNHHSERPLSDIALEQTSSTETNVRNGKTKTIPSTTT